MERNRIINNIGSCYLTANIENDEYSYVTAAGSRDKLKKLLGHEISHECIDIRLSDGDVVILIETKSKFVKKDEEQLAAYLENEVAVHGSKKIICILANILDDKIKVWKNSIDDESLLKKEVILKNFEYYSNVFKFSKQNDREKILRNTYNLNILLHKMDIPEKLRSQFVGTILLYLKELIGNQKIDKALVEKFNDFWEMSSAAEIITAIETRLNKLLDGSTNKDTKIKLLQRNVLENQKVKNLKLKNWIEILDTILIKIYIYIDMESSEGQDILNLFFIAFNKYTGKADKNQAFTPDHITDFMCRLTGVNHNSVVMDITCGSGSFLVQAMVKELADCNGDKELMKTVKTKHIFGIENEEKAYGLATTNMLIHGDGNSNIKFASCFDCEKFIVDASPDIILMNPPYNAKPVNIPDKYKKKWPKDEARKKKLSSKGDEEIAIKKSVEGGKEDPTKGLVFIHFLSDVVKRMKKEVTLAVLLPVSTAIGTSEIITEEKRFLLENNTLEAVFSLPNEIFYPGASASACCMLFTLGRPHFNSDGKPRKKTFFGYCKYDGFRKKKNLGRVEQFDEMAESKWVNVRDETWLKLFFNKEVRDGLSSMTEVDGDSEWLCEAYMKTDYSKLTEADFQQTINNYFAYLIKEGKKKLKSSTAPSLKMSNWKEFKIADIFHVKYGVNLELNACEEVERDTSNSVNFVSRTSENNGVSARVKMIDGIEPQKAGLISIAGGGSVLSTFLQNEPFYSGRDLYILESKENISNEAKLFIITIIEQNKYKYSYGRQANKTLTDIELRLPVDSNEQPDYKFMEDYIKSLNYELPTTNNNSGQAPPLKAENWKDFKVGEIFKCSTTELSIKDQLSEGDVPFISRSAENNGCDGFVEIDSSKINRGNCITIGAEGIFAFYQSEDFATGNKIYSLRNENLNTHTAIFICTLMNKEYYRYSYGRARILSKIEEETIRLPIDSSGKPDWQFMENYIKSLPYGDRL